MCELESLPTSRFNEILSLIFATLHLIKQESRACRSLLCACRRWFDPLVLCGLCCQRLLLLRLLLNYFDAKARSIVAHHCHWLVLIGRSSTFAQRGCWWDSGCLLQTNWLGNGRFVGHYDCLLDPFELVVFPWLLRLLWLEWLNRVRVTDTSRSELRLRERMTDSRCLLLVVVSWR